MRVMRTLIVCMAAVFNWLMKTPPAPRYIKFSQHPWVKRGHAHVVRGNSSSPRLGFAMAMAVVMALGVTAMVAVALMPVGASATLLAFPAAAATRDLKTVLGELKGLQTQYKGKAMPEDVATQFETLAKEAKEIQDASDREKLVDALEAKAGEITDDELPATGEQKRVQRDDEVVGYLHVGQGFVESPGFKQFLAQGAPRGESQPFGFKSFFGRRDRGMPGGVIPVTRKMLESKAVATLTDIIQPQRLTEIVRTTENDELTIRDLITVSQTNSNAVEYPILDSYTRAAAPVAESAAKPEATLAMETGTAPVRTIAVWMPITEQQLQDAPQLQGIIDDEMRYDLAKVEEEQMVWGAGTGQNLLGIFNTPGVSAGRTVGGDTLLDMIRRASTDVRLAGHRPTGVAIHPLDFETIVLLKGSDDRYLWVVVTDADGDRLWGLDVAETVAMEEPSAAATPERRLLVGDFRRGATLWDRMQAAVAIGWINDQFIKNQRTIRAEERVAFGVKRPSAFRYRITQAEVA